MLKKFKIIYQDKGIKEKIVEASSFEELTLPSNTISIKELNSVFMFRIKIKEKKLLFFIRELNLLLKANIPFLKTLEILINKEKDKNLKLFLQDLYYCFSNAKTLNTLKNKYNINQEVIAFFSLAQESGNIKLYISSLYELLKENLAIKRSFYKALAYPFLLLLALISCFIILFTFVVPRFFLIFQGDINSSSFATKSLFYTMEFFDKYFLILFVFFLLILIICIYLYFTNKNFVYKIDSFCLNFIPFYKNIYFYKLFLVLEIMLKSKYEFHRALDFSKLLINNKRLLDKMSLINKLLLSGRGIKDSFEKLRIFDETILSLIYSAELSNSLEESFKEIKTIYKDRFEQNSKNLIFLIEPVFLLFIVLFILWIVIAIFVPLWDTGNFMKF